MNRRFNIQMFAEGAAAAGTNAAGTGEATSTETVAKSTVPLTRRQRAKMAQNNQAENNVPVIYGKQEITTETPKNEPKQETKKTLAQLIEEDPDIKREYGEMTAKNVQKRYKTAEETEKAYAAAKKKLDSYGQMTEVLAHYYGLEADNADGVIDSVLKDNRFFKKDAALNGTSEDVERQKFNIERENRRLEKLTQAKKDAKEKAEKQKISDEKRAMVYENWDKDIPILKQLYPGFDMDEEMQNPEFAEIAVQGKLRQAYETVHREEIDAAMMKYAHDQAAAKLANSVAAGMSRPGEGAMSRESSPVYKSDPRYLTKADRKAIRAKVKKGERVIF